MYIWLSSGHLSTSHISMKVLNQGQMIDGEVATCEKHVTASERNDELEDSGYADEEFTSAKEECTVTRRWLGDQTLYESMNPGDQDATSNMFAKFENDFVKKLAEKFRENPRLLTEKGFTSRFRFDYFLNYYVEV